MACLAITGIMRTTPTAAELFLGLLPLCLQVYYAMVMETPSPQCVGREFVRQYYTLLNKAPLHLHRFYSQNSSFLHGGLDRPGQETKPVVGQHDIHQKIMQLNFKDCHAKIRQVDSHETLSNAVVVQVTGELSNNGQPMRRFMQTFVLAPQSPKKYYVRNDIFRYQDEIFTDDDEGENDNALADTDVDDTSQKQAPDALQDTENVDYYESDIVRNGSVHGPEAVSKFTTPQPAPEVSASPQLELEVESPKSEWEDEDEEEEEEEEEEELEDSTLTVERNVENSATSETESTPAISQEPKTYANMVSRNTPASSTTNIPPSSTATSPVASQPLNSKTEQTPAFHKSESGISPPSHLGTTPQIGSSFGPLNHRQSRPRMNSGRGMQMPPQQRYEGRDNTARSPEDFDAEKRKPPFIHYPDSQQLFVGNLTHSITEEDLKSHFKQYGTVLDMRINTKQNQKAGGAKVPNFGFIVFEDAESVQKVLEKRPIFFNDHRLNVEEKKRPKDNRLTPGENRIGPGRGGLPPRVMSGRGGRGSMLGSQGTGRGDARGGMKGSFMPRRSP